MSRHRNLKNMIDEAYEEDYAEDVDFYGDYELQEEDNEVINAVWEVVGTAYDKTGILTALDEVDWDTNDAINLILTESARFKKKKTQAQKKAEKSEKPKAQPNQPKGQPAKGNQPNAGNQTSKEENKDSHDFVKKQSSEELNPFRKDSEDLGHALDMSRFIDRRRFNEVVPELAVDGKILESTKAAKLLYVVVCGHVDSGKSTLVGHLLYDLGLVEKQTMHKYEKEATQMGKGSFKYAWIMDERAEERSRGVTIEVGIRQIETKNKTVVLLDAPGHQDYVSNMIGGTAQADTALLVVDSNTNAFDAGFGRGGQTREHAILCRSMGIENIIVAVNKLDTIAQSEERFNYIASLVVPFLEEIGFKSENVTTLPISGLTGDNVFTRSKKEELGWYEGPCLVEILDEMNLTPKNIKKPLRMILNSVYQSIAGKAKGLCFSGKVEAGVLEKGAKYVVMPACGEVTVKDLFIEDEKKPYAIPGDNVVLVIQAKEFDIQNFRYGAILCHMEHPIPVARKFLAEVEVFEFERPLIRGERTILYIGLNKIATVLTKIHHTIKKETGQVIKKNPRFISKGDMASVEILCERGTCMELFKNYPLFGRVILREKERTIASGVITEILE